MAFGTTILGPHGPVINNSIEDFSIPEDTIDDSTINIYHWFKDINNDPLEFKCEGQEHFNVTIDQQTSKVTLKPEKNWNGKEALIFYANDSVYEISDNITITVTPVNDPPGPASIITPKDDIKVENGTKINFSGICDDVDLIYGDKLTFNWSSNISGKFGSGENLTDIILQPGHHQILLEVSDMIGETSIDIVDITVLQKIMPNYIPWLYLQLNLVPAKVKLEPGGMTMVKAYVTNLGEITDSISLSLEVPIETGIGGLVNEPITLDAAPNSTIEFNITVNVVKDANEDEYKIPVTATSGRAKEYNLVVEAKDNLTVKIKIPEKPSPDKSSDLFMFLNILLIIIIIIIIIALAIFIYKRKKREKEKSEPQQAETIKPGELPTAEISIGQPPKPVQLSATSSSVAEQKPVPPAQDKPKLPGTTPTTLGTPPQLIPNVQQSPQLPPAEIKTKTEKEEKSASES